VRNTRTIPFASTRVGNLYIPTRAIAGLSL
jgi:hypothetical protein